MIRGTKSYIIVMSISHDEGVGPETCHIAINFRLSWSLDGTSHRDKTTPA